jgi:hypothetical protein
MGDMDTPGLTLLDGTFYPHSFDKDEAMRYFEFVCARSITMLELAEGGYPTFGTTIAIRHDVDHDVRHALKFAEWENACAIRSTYYLLPTADYWPCPQAARQLQAWGHEVGIHSDPFNDCTEPDCTAIDAAWKLRARIDEMWSWGVRVYGAADHGGAGRPSSDLWNVVTPNEVGLTYEAYQVQRAGRVDYRSDNRGRPISWQQADGPIVLLLHPEHWQVP